MILSFLSQKGNHLFIDHRERYHGGVFVKKEEIIITDPFGSYTGLVKDPNEKPVQDADDL